MRIHWFKIVSVLLLFLIVIKIPFYLLFSFNETINLLLDTSIQGILITFFAGLIIWRLQLSKMAGLTTMIINFRFYLFPLIIVFLSLYNLSLTNFNNLDHSTVVLFLFASVLVGLSEEFVFRGLIQSIILKDNENRKNYIVFSIIFTSTIFSLLHLMNIFKGFSNIESLINQLIFAFFMGIYLGSLLLITRQLFIVGILHGLVNFTYGFSDILDKPEVIDTNYTAGISQSIINIIGTTLVLSPILAIGLYQTLKINKVGINSQ